MTATDHALELVAPPACRTAAGTMSATTASVSIVAWDRAPAAL